MDSQHRHELQQNDLRKIANRALPFFEKYGLQIVIGLAVIVAVGIVAGFWYGYAAESTAKSWSLLDAAVNQQNPSADEFAAVADKYPGTEAAAWGTLKAADDYLKSGMQAVYTDRKAALVELEKAKETYQKLESPETPADIRERALYGLARCLETMSDGNTEDAIKVYSRLLNEFPDSMFKQIAEARIKDLESSTTKDFYAWFHAQNPSPEAPVITPLKKPDESKPEASSGSAPKPPENAGSGEQSSSPDEPEPQTTAPEEQPAEAPADAGTP
jgi:predicted negative regulator of RcsB-dependent stress response